MNVFTNLIEQVIIAGSIWSPPFVSCILVPDLLGHISAPKTDAVSDSLDSEFGLMQEMK